MERPGQTSADLDEDCGTTKSCKRMADVGFDGMADDDGDLRAAWRARLEREGKLNPGAGAASGTLSSGQLSPGWTGRRRQGRAVRRTSRKVSAR
jgi:hypothetical protein